MIVRTQMLLIVLWFLFFSVGCSSLRDSIAAYDACRKDSVCLSQMQKGKDLSQAISTAALMAVPQVAPIAPIVGSGLGMIVSALLGVYFGRKKRKGNL